MHSLHPTMAFEMVKHALATCGVIHRMSLTNQSRVWEPSLLHAVAPTLRKWPSSLVPLDWHCHPIQMPGSRPSRSCLATKLAQKVSQIMDIGVRTHSFHAMAPTLRIVPTSLVPPDWSRQPTQTSRSEPSRCHQSTKSSKTGFQMLETGVTTCLFDDTAPTLCILQSSLVPPEWHWQPTQTGRS